MKKKFLYLLLLVPALLIACDEGDIPEKAPLLNADGRAAKITVGISGADTWPSSYSIAVAAFADGDKYAKYVADLVANSDGTGKYTLYNIPDSVNTLEICAVNSLRIRMVTFASMDISQIADTIVFDAGNIDVSMYNAIQDNLFTNRCATCHGLSSGEPSAGLHLNKGQSYASLVNTASTKVDGGTRVVPNDASNSVIYKVLSTEISSTWGFPHTNLLASDDDQYKLRMLRDWINDGAKE